MNDELYSERMHASVSMSEDELKLTDREVMEHTSSIWKYRPIKDDGLEKHDENHAKHTVTSNGEMIGARVRGKKHKHDGTNCDDWFETAVTDGCFIAVVSDGAGSKQLSRTGAKLCCDSAVSYLKRELSALFKAEPGLKQSLALDMANAEFMAACGKIAPLVQNAARYAFDNTINYLRGIYSDERYIAVLGRAPELSDLSCTYLAAVVIPLDIGKRRENLIVTVQIGDGCICAINSDADCTSCLKLMGEPDSGAFSGETQFLSESAVSAASLAGKTRISRGCSDVIMLMTDGVADDYFPAEPMAKRLYLDLCLNGILPMRGIIPKPQLPEPISFPAVTKEGGSVKLQYAKQLYNSSDDPVNELWQRRNTLKRHSLMANGISLGDTPEQRLLTWLDNYNERGSFDDRTLVIILTDTKE
ncbi:MAG: protein phosphatase 2C domain-containing protein [Ruminococcaceae bacterium]|nr:protein phosphatase 2C domain-containing protein [Oscillospiraceae bacterium]